MRIRKTYFLFEVLSVHVRFQLNKSFNCFTSTVESVECESTKQYNPVCCSRTSFLAPNGGEFHPRHLGAKSWLPYRPACAQRRPCAHLVIQLQQSNHATNSLRTSHSELPSGWHMSSSNQPCQYWAADGHT